MNDERLTSADAKARGFDRATIARIEQVEEARSAAKALIPLIKIAFPGIPRPKVTLSVARGYDDEWNLSEERITELTALDSEQTWEDVSDFAIETHQEYFNFSDAEGWVFYLPAYLCHYLRGFPECDWDAVHDACETPRHPGLLNEEQLLLIDRFLDLCRKYKDRL